MAKEVKIGALVLVVVAVMVWGYNFLKGQDLFANSLSLEAHYQYVDQLSPSSPVLINGVKVGNVTAVELDRNDVKNVIVRFTIEKVSHVPKNSVASLVTVGLMGGKAIAIVFKTPCSGNGDCLEDGDRLVSETVGFLDGMIDKDAINEYVDSAKGKIEELMGTNNGGSSEFDEMLVDLKASMANLNNITEKVNVILASSAYDVKKVTKNLNAFSETLGSSGDKLTSILENVDVVTRDLKEAKIADAVSSVESTLTETKLAISNIKTTIEKTNKTMDKVDLLIHKVEAGEGSLGLLINDKELYKELENTSEEIGLLLQDLRLNPKRYINVSVFGKKQKNYTLPEDDPANGN